MKALNAVAAAAIASLGLVATAASAAETPAPPLAKAAAQQKPGIHTVHGISLYGDLKYGPDFKHFDYVNPDAPKGGTLRSSSLGSYDSFNPFSLRGTSAINIFNLNQTYDALMVPSQDERSTQYGLLAESVTYPDDYSWIEYNLRPNARWHDGKPITAEDVLFTFETMRDHSAPFYRTNYQQTESAKITGPRTVRIIFKEAGNRRNLMAFGSMAIIPKHFWEGRDFTAPIITPPVSSGPYKITKFELGRNYTLARVKDYWAKDLPVNRGRWNYDVIADEYFRDSVVQFEAFKAGNFDQRTEVSPKTWATGYVWPAAKHGSVVKAAIPNSQGFLYMGFFFNQRRALFQDRVLREALGYAFDFTWMNKNLFYDFFTRTRSYFGNDELAATGLPSAAELALLEPYRNQVPARVFTTEYNPPDTDGTQAGLRKNLGTAMQLLTKAGYTQKNGKLISPKTGRPVAFTILISDPAVMPVCEHWAGNLKLLGVDVTIRSLDLPQYIKATQAFDFDVIATFQGVFSSPGPEQRTQWGSQAADTQGSLNVAGVKNPVVDYLIEKLVQAQTRDDMLAALHALDRVLQWNFYSLPHYAGGGSIKVGYWDRFGRPAKTPNFGIGWTDTWWIDPKKDAALKLAREQMN